MYMYVCRICSCVVLVVTLFGCLPLCSATGEKGTIGKAHSGHGKEATDTPGSRNNIAKACALRQTQASRLLLPFDLLSQHCSRLLKRPLQSRLPPSPTEDHSSRAFPLAPSPLRKWWQQHLHPRLSRLWFLRRLLQNYQRLLFRCPDRPVSSHRIPFPFWRSPPSPWHLPCPSWKSLVNLQAACIRKHLRPPSRPPCNQKLLPPARRPSLLVCHQALAYRQYPHSHLTYPVWQAAWHQ